MKNLDQWLSEYSESHQNPLNQRIHTLCVPIIFLSIEVFLLQFQIFNVSAFVPTFILCSLFYVRLGHQAIVLFLIHCLAGWGAYALAAERGLQISIFVFVIAWIGQFVGHHIEGRRPSFFKDLQFLLVGPLWVFMGKHH